MNFDLDWGFTFAVVVIGLVVVFAVLVVLVLLCSVMGNTFKTIDKNKKEKADSKAAETQTQPVAPAVTIAAPVSQPEQPQIQSGITGDVVAAITAALVCVMGQDAKFAVKSIKRVRGSRTAWNAAGIAENTQPF